MNSVPIAGHQYLVIDGPREKPNGRLIVRMVRPDVASDKDVARFYVCEVVESMPTNGKTCAVGETIRVHWASFEKEITHGANPA